ncbi:MAG TPA: hypothetical protein VL484_18675 [Vicinamibacterales bacterium]|jgi:hypothetical protein|nr:hypothetical protein [Vicinamibacterales bacterium]
MTYNVEVVLRERNDAVTEHIEHGIEPRAWMERDVKIVLEQILRAIDRVKNPDNPAGHVALRGFSWIVEPIEGGVVIAVEIPMGAAVAGPFAIEQDRLDSMVRRVIAAAAVPRATVH